MHTQLNPIGKLYSNLSQRFILWRFRKGIKSGRITIYKFDT